MTENTNRRTGRLYALLMGAFFLSGFAALLYQVVWQRLLGLFSGSDVRSVTIVSGAYLAGLGVGSLVGTLFADRLSSRQAVRVYGLCNLGVGAFALASRYLYYDILYLRLNTLAESPALLLLLVFISLLIPTTLMGVSLPLLSRALVRSIEGAAQRISLLYGVNTFGAAAGTVISGWFLIGTFGYENAVFIGASLSALVAVIALGISPRFALADEGQAARPVVQFRLKDVPSVVWLWCLLVFTSGFIAISLEIIWFRVLDITLRSNAYTYAHLLSFFLVGDALGSIVGARFVHRIQNPRRAFLWIQGLVVVYSLVIIWGMVIFADVPPLSNHLQSSAGRLEFVFEDNLSTWFVFLVLPFIMIFPPAFLIGSYFPIVQKAVQTDAGVVGQRVGLVEVANIIGNTGGSIVTGLVLLHFLGTADSLRLLGVLGLLFVVVLLRELWRDSAQARIRVRQALGVGLAAGLVILIIAFPGMQTLWSQLHGIPPGADEDSRFVVAEDSTGVAALREVGESAIIYANGVDQGRVPFSTTHMMLGSLPALIHPAPERILIIGIGSGGTPYSAGVNPATQEIIAVEIIGSELDVLADYQTTAPILDGLLNDPRYQFVVGDGRREMVLSDQTFDIIEADAIRSYSSHSGLLYSREFFEDARAQLSEGGIMAQWRPTPRVERTFVSVFPYVVKVNENLLLGSSQPIPYDASALLGRLQEPGIRAYLEAGGITPETLADYITAQPQVWTPESARADSDINTDLFPRDEYYLNNENR